LISELLALLVVSDIYSGPFASLRANARPEEVPIFVIIFAVSKSISKQIPPVTAHPLFPCPLNVRVNVFRWLQSRQVIEAAHENAQRH
jgi:hypothetical protein